MYGKNGGEVSSIWKRLRLSFGNIPERDGFLLVRLILGPVAKSGRNDGQRGGERSIQVKRTGDVCLFCQQSEAWPCEPHVSEKGHSRKEGRSSSEGKGDHASACADRRGGTSYPFSKRQKRKRPPSGAKTRNAR